MKIRALFVVILLFSKITLSYSQTGWTTLEYNPDVPNIEHNPMKGWMPGYKGITSDFPYSIDHFYIRLSDVYKNWNDFDWTAFENELDRVTSGGRHVVCRFWIYYPNQTTGLPDFLVGDVPLYSDGSPNWNDEDLMLPMEEFIAEFGSRYDGDDRIAMIEAGLYGKWGEWHTYPENERQMTQANKDRLLIAYQHAFDTTHIGLRQSNHASTYELKMSVGYYDDSFAYNTLCTGGWCSWNGNIVPDGITDNYKYHPFAGELRPEIQSTIFDAWPNGTSNGEEDLETCIRTTHLSFMKAFYLYRNIPTPTEWEHALRTHKMMGYEFYVSAVQISSDAESNVNIDIEIQNMGVAPFYYNWDVEFAAISSHGMYTGTIGRADWNINTIYPDSAAYLKSFTTQIYGNDTYTVLMRFVNPLEEITENARDLRFANSLQDSDLDGWLTLGTVIIEAEEVEVTDVVIDNCPSDSINIGTTILLTHTVLPFNATNQNVIWELSDPGVATIDQLGEITPLTEGSTMITLYNHDLTITDQCLVNVKEPLITDDELISVNHPQHVSPGETVTVTVEYAATQELDIRAFIQKNSPPWDTYGSKKITIPAGYGILLVEFQIDKSIPLGNDIYKFVVNLLPVGGSWPDRIDEIIIPDISALVFVNDVSIDNCLEVGLPKGESYQLSATVLPANASDQSITWSSSNTSVATVSDNGLVTGIDDGIANIIVTTNDGSFTDICELNVIPVQVSGVSISDCPSENLIMGNIHQLTAFISPENAHNQTVTWTSSDTLVVIVDASGNLEALSAGSAVITVTTENGGYTDECTVLVDDATNVSPDIQADFKEVKIFPNPTSGTLFLEFSERDVDRNIMIYNIVGQVLYNDKIEDVHKTVDITNVVSSGIIYVQIQSAQNVATYKVFVLEK